MSSPTADQVKGSYRLSPARNAMPTELTALPAAPPTAAVRGMTTAAEIVDRAAGGPVVVIGSLPPQGRDLDVLVGPDDERSITARLAQEGFARRGVTWARFAACDAEVVDVLPAASWNLPAVQREALFVDARPLPGFEHLVVPAPHHRLLIAARLLGASGRLGERRAARVQEALREDPQVWSKAGDAAAAWGVASELDRLNLALQGRPRRVLMRTVAGLPRRARRGAMVTLSGVDGAGKTTQTRALAQSLERLGYEVVTEWSPLRQDRWLDSLSRSLKRMLRVVPALRRPSPAPRAGSQPGASAPEPTRVVGRDRGWVTAAWSTVVALANALAHARAVRHMAAGRVVIFDRYVLDSFARLRFFYGEDPPSGLQCRLIRALSPRPCAAFYLDIEPRVSTARKDDDWSPEELATQLRLYRQELRCFDDVYWLDGCRPVDELAAEIAEVTWRRLR